MIGDDVSTKHQHEWIVLSTQPVYKVGETVQTFTGSVLHTQSLTPDHYEVVLLCPHCERTKAFGTQPLD